MLTHVFFEDTSWISIQICAEMSPLFDYNLGLFCHPRRCNLHPVPKLGGGFNLFFIFTPKALQIGNDPI